LAPDHVDHPAYSGACVQAAVAVAKVSVVTGAAALCFKVTVVK
jgi:hypothetical protein